MNPDQRIRSLDGLGVTPHLDTARAPWVRAREIVDDDRGPPRALDVTVLLRSREIVTADLDRVALCVVTKADRDHVWGSVLPDRGQAAEPAFAGQVVALDLTEGAHAATRSLTRS